MVIGGPILTIRTVADEGTAMQTRRQVEGETRRYRIEPATRDSVSRSASLVSLSLPELGWRETRLREYNQRT